MKNLLYVLTAIFMVSCGLNSPKSRYEKTITDNLLKGHYTKESLNLQFIELDEHGTITVTDSIAYLTEEFRKDKQLIIKRMELAKKLNDQLLAGTKKQSDIDRYNADMVVINGQIDSLKNLTPDNLNGYNSRNANEVLAIIVRCKYSIQVLGSPIEETFDYYLSPDGTKFYGKKRAT